MKNKKDLLEIIFLGMITILLFAGLVLTAIHFKKQDDRIESSPTATKNTIDDSKNSTENQKEPEKSPPENLDEKAIIPVPSKNQNSSQEQPSSENNSNQEEKIEQQNPKEEDVIAYLESLEVSLVSSEDENSPKIREKAKNIFTQTVDFLFYGAPIKGYTFESLTTKTKLEVIGISLKIDHKIDSYFPNYKEKIKEKMTNLKGRAALLYLETTSKLCESVGDAACREARKDFKQMKNSFGFTWDIIKEATTHVTSSLKTILSEWYQSIQ